MSEKQIKSVQEWLPFKRILNNGIIQIDNNKYIKILRVSPINFNLKSDLEKNAILNSYKIFLKTCNFDIQILIQSNKENLNNHISKINNQKIIENENIKKISNSYIKYIKELNYSKKSSNKNFYIIIKEENNDKPQEIIIEELNDNYFKVKECLARCGNSIYDISNKKEVINILYSFVNRRKYNEEFLI